MYVRTKEEQIIKIDENGCIKEFNMFGKKTLFAFRDKNSSYRFENGREVIKQSENLEDLCDEFVLHNDKTTKLWFFEFYDLITEYLNEGANHKYTIYGAIWTSKGLIYVAKMDNKGKLVLI